MCTHHPPISDEEATELNIIRIRLIEVDDTGLVVKYECIEDDYTLLYEGNFVYHCQNDGTWNNTNRPQCVNGLLIL